MKSCPDHPDRSVYARGRCASCYSSIMRSVRQGELTEQEAVQLGYLLPIPRRAKCLNCKNKPYARGLCRGCYRKVSYAIASGKITEAYAVKHNMILPSNRG